MNVLHSQPTAVIPRAERHRRWGDGYKPSLEIDTLVVNLYGRGHENVNLPGFFLNKGEVALPLRRVEHGPPKSVYVSRHIDVTCWHKPLPDGHPQAQIRYKLEYYLDPAITTMQEIARQVAGVLRIEISHTGISLLRLRSDVPGLPYLLQTEDASGILADKMRYYETPDGLSRIRSDDVPGLLVALYDTWGKVSRNNLWKYRTVLHERGLHERLPLTTCAFTMKRYFLDGLYEDLYMDGLEDLTPERLTELWRWLTTEMLCYPSRFWQRVQEAAERPPRL